MAKKKKKEEEEAAEFDGEEHCEILRHEPEWKSSLWLYVLLIFMLWASGTLPVGPNL